MVLEETIAAIRPLDESAMEGARHHWYSIANRSTVLEGWKTWSCRSRG